jgi:hypothetical protein
VNATVLLKSVDISIPGYRILRPIGEGGMASVFLAIQESLDREVALKVMSPALAANTEFSQRFLIEGKITAKLQHPNLVTVYDIGSHNGVYYLAAEYIPGGTLKERIGESSLSVAEMLDVISDIALGLDFAHQKGFVHRDVKPGNVLFRNDGRVVLADFGIAKAMDGSNSSTVAGASIGTPDYMSPEQARGEPVDGRSDLYSLGTVLFEMLTGAPPYQAGDPFAVALMHVTQPVPLLPEEHGWLQPLIDRLMAKSAADRFNTGAAFVDAVHKLVAEAPPSVNLHQAAGRKAGTANRLAGSSATQQRTRVNVLEGAKAGSRPLWLWPALAGGVLLVGVGSWLALRPGEPARVDSPVVPSQPPANDLPVTNVQDPVSVDDAAQRLETLLTQADVLYRGGIDPADPGRNLCCGADTSFGLYNQAYEIDPQNQRALQGMANIGVFYASYAWRLCEQQQWQACGLIARQGMQADPSNATLIRLNEASAAGERGESPNLPAQPPEPAPLPE